MAQISFHYGLYYNAMIGLIGREPDLKTCLGFDGFYEFRYEPKDDKEAEHFKNNVYTLARWLDLFNITFSGSRCEFGMPTPPQKNDKEVLQIRISHPVKKSSKRRKK